MFGRGRRGARPAPVEVMPPVAGRAVALADVPDPVFAQGLVGEGFAVAPEAGVYRAPVTGTVVLVAETGHAYAVRTDDGLEVLVHIGIDTVALKGRGFRVVRWVGERVEAGAPVVEVDLEAIRDDVTSLISPVLVTSTGTHAVVGRTSSGGLLVSRKD